MSHDDPVATMLTRKHDSLHRQITDQRILGRIARRVRLLSRRHNIIVVHGAIAGLGLTLARL